MTSELRSPISGMPLNGLKFIELSDSFNYIKSEGLDINSEQFESTLRQRSIICFESLREGEARQTSLLYNRSETRKLLNIVKDTVSKF